jgi:hypothetical protein
VGVMFEEQLQNSDVIVEEEKTIMFSDAI